jgi:hypothetical protein
MKKVTLRAAGLLVAAGMLLSVLLLSSCDRLEPPGQEISSLSGTLEKVSLLLAGKPQELDVGLYLYRIPFTRPLVESFYAEVTGDERITRSILVAADSNEIPLPLAFSLAWGESSFRVKAFNRNPGSVDRGLYQLNSKTFSFLSVDQFYTPEINARYGLAHLRFCLEEGDTELVALAMYNAGTTRVVSRGTPYTTLHHVAKIMDYQLELERSFLEMLTDPGRIAAAMSPAGDS